MNAMQIQPISTRITSQNGLSIVPPISQEQERPLPKSSYRTELARLRSRERQFSMALAQAAWSKAFSKKPL